VRGARPARASHRTAALLLRRVELGESDLVLALFTESLGRISALARGARKSAKRFGGALEPFHTMALELDEPASGELFLLRDATIDTTRLTLTTNLERMEAAGRALAWVRAAAPQREPEPAIWRALQGLHARLDEVGTVDAKVVLAEQGLALLSAFGWGLDFAQCVRCGKPCEPARAAMVDAERGGLVCRACGGARLRLSGKARERLALGAILPEDADTALDLVERAIRAHVGNV
jgi:DNA repair protein RecO (recombination protein O)